MHYTDRKQLDENTLSIVVYKHSNSYDKKADYEIASIQECHLFSPSLLRQILKKPNKSLKKYLDHLQFENWYLLTIKQTDWQEFEVNRIEDVSHHEDDSFRLH